MAVAEAGVVPVLSGRRDTGLLVTGVVARRPRDKMGGKGERGGLEGSVRVARESCVDWRDEGSGEELGGDGWGGCVAAVTLAGS